MALPPLPTQPVETPWPTASWPLGPVPDHVDGERLAAHLGRAFADPAPDDLGQTEAVIIVHAGRIVVERYGAGRGPDDTCRSWSMAKSITHALAGILAGDGHLNIAAPADVPEWSGDERAAITLDQLLHMSSGLAFVEAYSPDQPSDVIEMLFGKGADDTAAFAAAFPLAHPPGSFFSYSSGTTNIVCRCLARALGADGASFEAFMRARLFAPLGMTSAAPRFDPAGTFIGSSFCFATPRDFARFGLFYLRDGVWEGARLLPAGWVDYARTPTFQQADYLDAPYGAHWWLDLAGPGTFSANGYEGQYIVICPDRDLVIVRNGVTAEANQPLVQTWLADLVGLFG
ncbi:MAG TPA: serine hydrolase [Caulobacteraceae bacterium]|jgi:CubicO group peptidase (beta-lactamase class C family)